MGLSKKRDEQSEPPEITSFNEELVSFNLDAMSVEELERRFELALAIGFADGGCGTLVCGTVLCGTLGCGTMKPPV
jgi:hypothetical protein